MKLLRVFIQNDQIVETFGLEGSGDFPKTIADSLSVYPAGTYCIVLDDTTQIDSFLQAGNNTVVDGKLAIGKPGIAPEIPKARDLAKEIDALKTLLTSKGIV